MEQDVDAMTWADLVEAVQVVVAKLKGGHRQANIVESAPNCDSGSDEEEDADLAALQVSAESLM